MSVKVGDRVTCIGMATIAPRYVTRVDPDGEFVVDYNRNGDGFTSGSNESLCDEGIEWIRGWHRFGSAEVKAAQVARMLRG